jgi:DAACS family dicarboxylate/amino acid:cation (Na+ or H+) symporter
LAPKKQSASEGAAQGEKRPRVPFYLTIVGAMALGLAVGPFLGPEAAAPLGEFGKLVIQLIKAVATPLLFFAVVQAILKTSIAGKAALRMLGIATVNVTVAVALGLLASNLIRPGEHLTLAKPSGDAAGAYAGKKVDLVKTLVSYVPSNFVTPFAENLVISIIILALLVGFGLRRVRNEQELVGSRSYAVVEDAVTTLQHLIEVVLGWVLKLIPFAVMAVAAKTVAEHGYAPLRGLLMYVVVGLLGLSVHVAVTYQAWLVLVARIPLRRFWHEAREPLVCALGTNSSLATLPVTLQALDRLKVSRSASTLGACVGTNLNNDGIVLYEGMAVLFVAQASGIHLSLSEQITAALVSMVAAMGVAGVPEAGFVSLALVLNTVGLPIELLPLILTVDWVLARARSVTNVLSDMVLSIVIDRTGSAPQPSAGTQTSP